jgi:hypothetical protein
VGLSAAPAFAHDFRYDGGIRADRAELRRDRVELRRDLQANRYGARNGREILADRRELARDRFELRRDLAQHRFR